MEYRDFQIVLASLDPPSVFQFYETAEKAQADMERANTREYSLGYQYSHVMTHDEYKAAERAHYLARPVQEIEEKRFIEMFEVLPPKGCINTDGFSSFLMIEHWSGPYTDQYAALRTDSGTRYFRKLVDAGDRSTWMTRESLQAGTAGGVA